MLINGYGHYCLTAFSIKEPKNIFCEVFKLPLHQPYLITSIVSLGFGQMLFYNRISYLSPDVHICE